MSACTAFVLSLLLDLQVWYQDVDNSVETRTRRLEPIAAIICAATSNPREQAFLILQGDHETHYAKYVLEERCSDGPKGARCDNGLATSPWQVHKWCRAAWPPRGGASSRGSAPTAPVGRLLNSNHRFQRFLGAARCALQTFRAGLARCGTLEGAFHAQLGIADCSRPLWTVRRAERLITFLAKHWALTGTSWLPRVAQAEP